jgi:hypothetical protein
VSWRRTTPYALPRMRPSSSPTWRQQPGGPPIETRSLASQILKTARTKSVRWALNESDRSPRRGDRDLASYRDPVSRREIRGNGLLDHGARARPATLPAAPGRDQAGERQHEPASLQRHATPRRTAPPDSSPASTSSSRPAARRGCGRPTRSTSGGAPRSRTRARTGSCGRAERYPGSRSGA